MDRSSISLADRDASTPTRVKARIVIPVWGAKYIDRLAQLCLPALLAPGNLPYLAEHADCELTICTESKLFDMVRELPVIKEAQRYCTLRLTSIDDVLSHPAFYGYTITHALYRGFIDLGEAAKDTWFLFLNADFILADGSYREVVRRMLAGERIIFAPSYCTIEENVFPVMTARRKGNVVAIPPREMAGLILDNRHFTIRSKIVNWKMYRIDRVDQFYYVHDNDTMLGRQIPIAVVAFRPMRVPSEPVSFWDYGIISEVCPGCSLSVIGDSDQFLMMELRRERTMSEQVQLGWMDKEEIARDLEIWTTADQRACGVFPLVVHRRDLPADYAQAENALDEYYRDVMSRVTCEPRDYRDHQYWREVIGLHSAWVAAPKDAPAEAAPAFSLFAGMRAAYHKLLGAVPEVGPAHPYWADLHPVMERIRALAPSSQRGLAITGKVAGMISPRLDRWVPAVDHFPYSELLDEPAFGALAKRGPYDLCLVELVHEELLEFGKVHTRLRRLLRKGGRILVFCRLRDPRVLDNVPIKPRDFNLIAKALPACDVAELYFAGGPMLQALQAAWESRAQRIRPGSNRALLGLALTALAIAPVARLANWRASRRPAGKLPKDCTSLLLDVTVL